MMGERTHLWINIGLRGRSKNEGGPVSSRRSLLFAPYSLHPAKPIGESDSAPGSCKFVFVK